MRHPLHSICPYFAMFPESFVLEQLYAHTQPGDTVLDPFCGRGTTVLESLLNNRQAIGTDINPVAACVAGAKADVPEANTVLRRLDELAREFYSSSHESEPPTDFFSACFHSATLEEILFLRGCLDWQYNAIDRFIAAIVLGALHGESHRSTMYLSNRMPRTISTKPEYSIRWWKERGLSPPRRPTFDILREIVHFRFSRPPPNKKGYVVLSDARLCEKVFAARKSSVKLIVTSPPYLDITDYAEDQWLRLWFLGGLDRPVLRLHKDDRHTQIAHYWQFMEDVWKGCAALLCENAVVVVRIGGLKMDKAQLLNGLHGSLSRALLTRVVRPLNSGHSSKITRRQTHSFRPGTADGRLEHDFTFCIT